MILQTYEYIRDFQVGIIIIKQALPVVPMVCIEKERKAHFAHKISMKTLIND